MFADQLKQERERLGITQAQAASLLGVSKSVLAKWEIGNRTAAGTHAGGRIAAARINQNATPMKTPNSVMIKETDIPIKKEFEKLPISSARFLSLVHMDDLNVEACELLRHMAKCMVIDKYKSKIKYLRRMQTLEKRLEDCRSRKTN